eukprot:1696081-Pyramimonas_sp.AAC.1
MHGPLPTLFQTVPAAERFICLMALRYMGAQMQFFTDCKPLVDVWRQGSGAGTDAGDPLAFLWRE